MLFGISAKEITDLRLLLGVAQNHHLFEDGLLSLVIFESSSGLGLLKKLSAHNWLQCCVELILLILFALGLVPQIEKILVESGTCGEKRCGPSPISTRLLHSFSFFDFLVVCNQSSFAFIRARLVDQAAEPLEIGCKVPFTLLMLLCSKQICFFRVLCA